MITAPASVRQETCPPPPSTDPANCAYTFEIVGSEGSCSGETIRRVKLTFPAAITATDIIASYIGPNSDPIDITNITVDPNNNRIVYICVSGSFPSGLPVPGQTPPSNSLGSYQELTVSMGNTTCCVRLQCHNSGGSTYTIAADTCTNF